MKSIHFLILLAIVAAALFVFAAPPIKVTVEGIPAKGVIPEQYALCKSTPNGKSGPGANQRPTISWTKAPKAAKSFAVIITDPDVPTDFTNAGKEGKTVTSDMPRQLFYHWALIDIPTEVMSIPGGDARKILPMGKALKSDLGSYVPSPKQYGGPCPPWNDLRMHHYHFTVYALDVSTLDLKPNTSARDAAAAIQSHTVASGELVGTYTLNPSLRK